MNWLFLAFGEVKPKDLFPKGHDFGSSTKETVIVVVAATLVGLMALLWAVLVIPDGAESI